MTKKDPILEERFPDRLLEHAVQAPSQYSPRFRLLAAEILRLRAVEANWRAMFSKYMRLVERAEGVDFMYEHEWTPDEWADLKPIIDEQP